jgi:hypothetical protein
LTGGVHAAIRTPRSRYLDGFMERRLECGFQDARDGARFRLPLESTESRAVILDGETKVDRVYRPCAVVTRCARRSSASACANSRRNAASCIMTKAASVPAVHPEAISVG